MRHKVNPRLPQSSSPLIRSAALHMFGMCKHWHQISLGHNAHSFLLPSPLCVFGLPLSLSLTPKLISLSPFLPTHFMGSVIMIAIIGGWSVPLLLSSGKGRGCWQPWVAPRVPLCVNWSNPIHWERKIRVAVTFCSLISPANQAYFQVISACREPLGVSSAVASCKCNLTCTLGHL